MCLTQRHLICALALTVGILAPGTCLGRQKPIGKPAVADLLTELHDRDWSVRYDDYARLREDPIALARTDVRRALLDLLDREDLLVESALRESHEEVGVSGKYGEGFSEYLGQLGQTVDAFADWTDPRQVCILVRRAYDSQSRFARTIASHGKIAMPCLIQLYRSDVGLIRAKAPAVIIQVLADSKNKLDRHTIQVAKDIVLRALRDPSEAVRIDTVQALRDFGDADMISALKQVAERDPSPEVNGYSIRKWASEAITKIEQRARNQKKL